jgi:hypothetical protein
MLEIDRQVPIPVREPGPDRVERKAPISPFVPLSPRIGNPSEPRPGNRPTMR